MRSNRKSLESFAPKAIKKMPDKKVKGNPPASKYGLLHDAWKARRQQIASEEANFRGRRDPNLVSGPTF
ncbi:MAG: hypothetical protein ABSF66_03470 [Terriglobales bacterium]|jgi:hypothetical protein